nr:hypothetical protein [Solimonas flava]
MRTMMPEARRAGRDAVRVSPAPGRSEPGLMRRAVHHQIVGREALRVLGRAADPGAADAPVRLVDAGNLHANAAGAQDDDVANFE